MTRPSVSATDSTVAASADQELYADNTPADIVVMVKDTNGDPIGTGATQDATAEVTIDIESVDGHDTLIPPGVQLADSEGIVRAQMTSARSGEKTIKVSVLHDDDNLNTVPRPNVLGAGSAGVNGNAGLSNPAALVGSTSGNINASISDTDFTNGVVRVDTADPITITNCRFASQGGDGYAVLLGNNAGRVDFVNCEFDGGRFATVRGRNMRMFYCWVKMRDFGDGVEVAPPNNTVQQDAFFQGCLIEHVSGGTGNRGAGIRADNTRSITVRGTYINVPIDALAAVSAEGTSQPVQSLFVESCWLSGGVTTVRIIGTGDNVPLVCPVQNIRWGRTYGGGGLLRHDAIDADRAGNLDEGVGSLLAWAIWDDNIQHITMSEGVSQPGFPDSTWVNRELILALDGRFKYDFPVTTLDAQAVLTFGQSPFRGGRQQVAVGRARAGGVSTNG